MSRRYLFVLNVGQNLLLSSIPKSITIRFDNKLKIKLIKNTNKSFLSPKVIDYANYVHKRNFSSSDNDEYNRHIYDKSVEKLINEQINVEFGAGYTYLAMANYYGRSNVALPGLFGYFMKMYYEEQDHAMGFIKYQILRGGVVCLKDISPCEESEFPDIVKCINRALTLEKTVKEKLRSIYKEANNVGDTNVLDMLDPYILEQEKSICELARLYTRASELTCTEVGRYLFDRELHETHVKKDPGKCETEIGSKLYT